MKISILYITIIGLILLLFAASIACGAVDIPLGDISDILLGGEGGKSSWRYIIIESRLPQALTALLAGSSLAITGLMLQTAFRNSLAGPGIFGISSGASLGVALIMLIPGMSSAFGGLTGFMGITIAAFAGAMAVMGIIMGISLTVRNNMMLLIAGIMTGYLASSAISLLNFFAGAESVQSYMIWGLGSFSGVTLAQLPYFGGGCLVGILASLLLIKPLNIMLLGESYATNLGISPQRLRNALLIITGWLTAVVTAYCGPISFIGLAVPHISKMIFHTDDHSILMPATIGIGGVVGLLCNIVCSLPAADASLLPLNAITPVIGAPVIIYVLIRHGR
ncbi:MAG: iron ABC transporter permease [Clostridium sp.]|nr:iron ABC transporter permease [Prevotella sp.]MCM1429368.1 iron ABC transporter permease [Clostridium sp.]MCM1475597.1 iron ABC transporter permease [Muribaculaceae bacterium]